MIKKIFSTKLLPLYIILLYILTYKHTNKQGYNFMGNGIYLYYFLLLFAYVIIGISHHFIYKYCSSIISKIIFYINILLFSLATIIIFRSSFKTIFQFNFIQWSASIMLAHNIAIVQFLLILFAIFLWFYKRKKI